jgi:hypothetical protein
MANGIVSNLPNSRPNAVRPPVTSYDFAYEHSVERYVDVRLLVHAADQDASDVPATLAFAS